MGEGGREGGRAGGEALTEERKGKGRDGPGRAGPGGRGGCQPSARRASWWKSWPMLGTLCLPFNPLPFRRAQHGEAPITWTPRLSSCEQTDRVTCLATEKYGSLSSRKSRFDSSRDEIIAFCLLRHVPVSGAAATACAAFAPPSPSLPLPSPPHVLPTLLVHRRGTTLHHR